MVAKINNDLKTNCFFSVIVPVYNLENCLEDCLSSLLTQRYKDFETIIVDDGSVDNSLKIAQKYSTKKENVKIISKINEGVSVARNTGIDVANGEYIVFVDGDDVLSPNYLLDFYESIEENQLDFVACGILINNKNIVVDNELIIGKVHSSRTIIKEILKRDSIGGYPFNKAFKREIIKNNNIKFNSSISMCEDLIFCLDYANFIQKALIIRNGNYNYIQRKNGAVKSKFSPKKYSVITSHKIVLENMNKTEDYELIEMAKKNLLIMYVDVFVKTIFNKSNEIKKIHEECSEYVRNNKLDLFLLDKKTKVKYLLAKILSFVRV